ncbi:cilia- and flagella-associated protein 221 isoform X1 [Lampetra planeri]
MQAMARPYSSGELSRWRPALQPQDHPDPARPSAPSTTSSSLGGPRRLVPNHLLQTRTFRNIVKNQVVEAKPGILHFGGYELGKQHAQDVKLINISAECINMHIIPPQSKHFQVKYSKKGALVPGLSLRVCVEFCPDEWRYYYDCIRVHCQGDETLLVPIHGYPVVNVPDLPSFLNIPDTALGESREVAIPLRCSCPIDFEFQVSITQPNPAITVTPSSGLIPAHGETRLAVRFSPREFCTARATLSLLVSQFNAKPLECTVTGTSTPGTHARRVRAAKEDRSSKAVPSPIASQGPQARRTRRLGQLSSHPSGSVSGIVAGGASLGVPPRLDTVFAVSRILCEQPDRSHARDLRDAERGGVGRGGGGGGQGSRHAAEALFLQKVARFTKEERANMLRWQVHLGSEPLTSREKWELVEARRVAVLEYQRSRGEHVGVLAQPSVETVLTSHRSCRLISQELPVPPGMDVLANDPWLLRQRALGRLQQAARKVIVRARLMTRLARLKALPAQEDRVQPHTGHVSAEREATWSGDESEEEEERLLKISIERILPVSFKPVAVGRLFEDNASRPSQPQLLEPTEVRIPIEVPYLPLKVNLDSQQLGRYRPVSVHDAFLTYSRSALPIGPRSLPPRPQEEQQQQQQLSGYPAIGGLGKSEQTERGRETTQDPDGGPKLMSPPAALLLTPPHPSPLLFSAVPSLQARVSMLPHVDVHLDSALPSGGVTWGPGAVARRPRTQRRAFTSRDAGRGAMEWQRFLPPGLLFFTSSSQANSTTPSWTMLAGAPTLLLGEALVLQRALSPEDQESIGGGAPGIALTPSMVAATFVLPDSGSGPRV